MADVSEEELQGVWPLYARVASSLSAVVCHGGAARRMYLADFSMGSGPNLAPRRSPYCKTKQTDTVSQLQRPTTRHTVTFSSY